MALLSFGSLYRLADQLPAPLPVVVAGGADRTVLESMSLAHRRGWVEPILAGAIDEMRTLAKDLDVDLSEFRLIDSSDPAAAAVAEVRAGRARLLMKGQIATPALMKAVLNREVGLRTNRCICQVVLMEIPRDSRRFLLSDTGITVEPTLDQKVDILNSMVDVARALNDGAADELPRIGVMSATEKVTDAMPDTREAAELVRRNIAGDITGCVVQGPLSFDLAYASDAGEKKRIEGAVVGAADAMLFPNLLAANLTVKAIMYTADCRFGGVLCGAACPVVFMSRADSTETRLNSLAFTLRMLTAKDGVPSHPGDGE
ncbi:phosphate acyltransferase [Schlesneria paludicola]|uniref:phosphate acyltransferase n=1 Tax=Schlesneria paludicola TaxID=360056 RepID=UPI00029AB641|nr:phosphate acyltransferase [Schlesneria paludicola]